MSSFFVFEEQVATTGNVMRISAKYFFPLFFSSSPQRTGVLCVIWSLMDSFQETTSFFRRHSENIKKNKSFLRYSLLDKGHHQQQQEWDEIVKSSELNRIQWIQWNVSRSVMRILMCFSVVIRLLCPMSNYKVHKSRESLFYQEN